MNQPRMNTYKHGCEIDCGARALAPFNGCGGEAWKTSSILSIFTLKRPEGRAPCIRGVSVFSLTPWLQPGVKRRGITTNRFNGLPDAWQAVKTAEEVFADVGHRAKAAVSMKRPTLLAVQCGSALIYSRITHHASRINFWHHGAS
jgi:hypothetical protein